MSIQDYMGSENVNDVNKMVCSKLNFYRDVIQKTYRHVIKNQKVELLGTLDINRCINLMKKVIEKICDFEKEMKEKQLNVDYLVLSLQNINNDMSNILKTYGTHNLEDLLSICLGVSNINLDPHETKKYEVLKKCFHPVSYKTNHNKNIIEKMEDGVLHLVDKITNISQYNLQCVDVATDSKAYHMKVYGMRLFFYHKVQKKFVYIYGLVDDVLLDLMKEKYIDECLNNIYIEMPTDNEEFNINIFPKFIDGLTIRELLIYNQSGLYNLFINYATECKKTLKKPLTSLTKDFLAKSLYMKRQTLIQLLISSDKYESKYICYLLYDLLSNDVEGKIDTEEQLLLLNSLPMVIRGYFNNAMKDTIKYTNDLSSYDTNKIPLEQQICLMKANDTVKEKAMVKLKEVKAKSEDTGSKARQYLDGLLKIPFGMYNKEPIMDIINQTSVELRMLIDIVDGTERNKKKLEVPFKDNYTSIEILILVKKIKDFLLSCSFHEDIYKNIYTHLLSGTKGEILDKIKYFNEYILSNKGNNNNNSIVLTGKSKKDYPIIVSTFLKKQHNSQLQNINDYLEGLRYPNILKMVKGIQERMNNISDYMKNVRKELDNSVHGHEKAKSQIEKIIAQWINGTQEGYCFGFEGAPGVGKTSLAKYGLSKCLIDTEGNPRPFAMIAIGGDANGSTLHGHNYTYVGSSWGAIVQILMDKKCMNPIIFIDELDKISRTENGREIVGILTHLLDPTQNDSFQDKYFQGINIDLSKALFVLSYNDVDVIDRVLLDRIHRIKFSNLKLKEKVHICHNHLLPNIYKKMGLEGMINFSDEALIYIIEYYTLEAGVRKLKEKLFDIVGDINLNILQNNDDIDNEYPLDITIDNIKNKYFKNVQDIRIKQINPNDRIGHANGMWANAIGQGGTLPIEASMYPSEQFLQLKLTGMQGDVMQESMNVALTIAYRLTPANQIKEIEKKYNKVSKWGIHLHTPSASDPKNGPSAGSCITSVIYSLLNNKPIKHEFALTGEIRLDGSITAIGGLDLKILGSMKSGITNFIYPEENQRDVDELKEKCEKDEILKGIELYPVSTIEEVFSLIF